MCMFSLSQLSDASSSDEDPFGRPWWQGCNNKFVPKDKDDDIFVSILFVNL